MRSSQSDRHYEISDIYSDGKQYIVNGTGYTLAYRVLKYSIGGAFTPAKGPVFLDFGWEGERGTVRQNAPSNYTENGPFVGLGIHF